MGRRNYERRAERIVAAQAAAQAAPSTPWYATNGFKIGAGIAGIVIVLAVFLVVKDLAAVSATPTGGSPTSDSPAGSSASGDTQVVKMSVNGFTYSPATITVQAGRPVRWEIDASHTSGCALTLYAAAFGINQPLTQGMNVVEFTPQQKGTFPFSCSMNMVRGTMNVV